jgi:hypothetical protein
MKRPDFTDAEQEAIKRLMDFRGDPSGFVSAYLGAGFGFFLVALLLGSMWMLAVVLLFVCCCRLYEEWHYRPTVPMWKSVIGKYEAAIASIPDHGIKAGFPPAALPDAESTLE